jgi:hypothetical protein
MVDGGNVKLPIAIAESKIQTFSIPHTQTHEGGSLVFGSLILAAAVAAQAPASKPLTEAELAARTAKLKAEIQAKAKARADAHAAAEARMTPQEKAARAREFERLRQARMDRIQAELGQLRIAREKAQREADAKAERLLPYQMEAQRQMLQRQSELEQNLLELRRQALARQSEAERNAALHRMAGSMERMSGLYTPGNSGVAAPQQPQIAPHMAGWPW